MEESEGTLAAEIRRSSTRGPGAAALAIGLAAGLAGCATAPSVPRPMGMGPKPGPTVDQVVEHVNCEIARAIKAHDNALWAHLKDENFVAAIQLTLEISDTASLNPDLSFIDPIAGAGQQSRTLAVGGQYNSSRDSQFLVSYIVDLNLLSRTPPADCKPAVGPYLGGDLHLAEVIDDGLTAIDRTSRYALYGLEGPDPSLVSTLDKTTNTLELLSRSGFGEVDRLGRDQLGALLNEDLATRAAIAASGAGDESPIREKLDRNHSAIVALNRLFSDQHAAAPQALAEAAAEATASASVDSQREGGGERSEGVYFQSRIDFAVQTGVSGGPNWTLVHFRGPAGGGGGGGLGRLGAGGSGAGAAAGQNLLGYSRAATDAILVTFEASCASKPDPSVKDYWNSVSPCSAVGMHTAKHRAASDAQSHNELGGIILRR